MMIIRPIGIESIVKIDFSWYLKIAAIPKTKPSKPKKVMTKVPRGIRSIILRIINRIKARVSPADHLPSRVLGFIPFIRSPPSFGIYWRADLLPGPMMPTYDKALAHSKGLII